MKTDNYEQSWWNRPFHCDTGDDCIENMLKSNVWLPIWSETNIKKIFSVTCANDLRDSNEYFAWKGQLWYGWLPGGFAHLPIVICSVSSFEESWRAFRLSLTVWGWPTTFKHCGSDERDHPSEDAHYRPHITFCQIYLTSINNTAINNKK